MVRSTHRATSSHRPHDVRRFADAAHADVASVATSLALLAEANNILLEQERNQIQAGIKSKCATAIANLKVIASMMGGDL